MVFIKRALCILILSVTAATQPPKLPILPRHDFLLYSAMPVLRVIDGDTIVVANESGQPVTIRLVGVNTPETKHPTKPVEFYGPEASLFLRNLLTGERVYVIYDTYRRYGVYGRTLAYIYRAPDGLFVNPEILRQGYGSTTPKYPCQLQVEFAQLQDYARKLKKGKWAYETN